MSTRRSSYDHRAARRLARKMHWRQKGLCFWCQRPMTLDTAKMGVCEERTMTADHVVALADGGQTRAGNIVAACYACNNARTTHHNRTKKGNALSFGDDRPLSPFEILQAWVEQDETERKRRKEIKWLVKTRAS